MKRCVSIIVLLFFLGTNFLVTNASENSVEIFVSPSGNDKNNGDIDHPLATLEGAKILVQKLKGSSKNSQIRVNFLEGDYHIQNEISFSTKDSGTADAPVVYCAYNGAKVRFLGSIDIDYSNIQVIKDQDTLKRMTPESYGKVGVIDLKSQGIKNLLPPEPTGEYGGYTANNDVFSFSGGSRIFLNGYEETVAKYPNNFEEINVSKALQGPFSVPGNLIWEVDSTTAKRMSRWINAKDALAAGRFTHGYRYEINKIKEFDPKKKTITTEISKSGVSNGNGYQVVNLLEEIDVPGEYYIDSEKGKLYYYPSKSLKDANLSVSVVNDFIKFNNASNINFENIFIEQFCRNAVTAEKSDNINFLGCKLYNIGGNAFYLSKSKNLNIQSCDISYIGQSAIKIFDCGDFKTLEPGNIKIENNNIYYCEMYKQNSETILLKGVGCFIEHNIIGRSMGTSVRYQGNDNKINYNEIYDTGYRSDDGGAIYIGQNPEQRGNEVAYNFINGAISKGNAHYGIYVDDMACGVNAHHNVVKDTQMGFLFGGGRNNIIDSNIVINTVNPIKFDDRMMTWAAGSKNGAIAKVEAVNPSSLPYSKYEGLANYVNDNPEIPKYNEITNNLYYKCSSLVNIAGSVKEYGKVENNQNNNDVEFNDVENNDYGISESSSILKEIPSLKEIDFSKIGNYTDDYRKSIEPIEIQDFKLFTPANGTKGVTNRETIFTWARALGASEYLLEVSEDKDFKTLLNSEVCKEEKCVVTGIPAGFKTIYWRVKAYNKSRQIGNEKFSPVYKLQTAETEILDTLNLEKYIKSANGFITEMTEGTRAGEFAAGSKELVQQAIDEANVVLKNKKSYQKDIDRETNNLRATLEGIDKAMNVDYVGIDNMVKSADDWISDEGNVTIEDGNTILNTDEACTFKEKTPIDSVLCFQLKMNGFNGSWMPLGINQTNQGGSIVNKGQGYMICITGAQIENQKWNGRQSIIVTPNSYIAEDVWQDVQVGAIKVGNAVKIVLNIDGQQVFDDLDIVDTAPLSGYFSLGARNSDTYMSIRPSNNIPEKYVGSLQAANDQIAMLKTSYNKGDNGALGINQINAKEYSLSEFLNTNGNISGEIVSAERADANSKLKFNASFNVGDGYRSIAFRKSDNQKSFSEGANGYEFVVKADKIFLKKYKNGKSAYLSIKDKKLDPSRTYDISITSVNLRSTTNITVMIDGETVICYEDQNSIAQKGFVSLSGSPGSSMTLNQ